MAEERHSYPHITLRFITEGRAKPGGGGSNPNKPTQTALNLANRQGHGSHIKSSVSSFIADWQNAQEQREEDAEVNLPPTKAMTLILQVDPKEFDIDDLRTSGIEILSELEDGYIIAASADADLTEFQNKIDLFLNQQRGGNVIAKVLNILDRQQRPEFILSEALLEKWNQIKDDQMYVVEVGVSCLGPTSKLTEYPNQRNHNTPESYSRAINEWIEKRNVTYQEWDEIASDRQQQLIELIEFHRGEFLNSFEDGITPRFSQAPDRFS